MLAPVTDWYFCEVTVIPDYRRRGLGTRLYAAAYEPTASVPVVTRAMSSQPIRRRFASPSAAPPSATAQTWIDPTSTAGQNGSLNTNFPAATELAMDELPIERVEQAWATYFEWAHRPFGPCTPTISRSIGRDTAAGLI